MGTKSTRLSGLLYHALRVVPVEISDERGSFSDTLLSTASNERLYVDVSNRRDEVCTVMLLPCSLLLLS